MSSLVNVLIMAGAPNDGKLSASSDEKFEALVKINDKPMLAYVINGVIEATKVDEIVVVCQDEVTNAFKEIEAYKKVNFVRAKDNIVDNIMIGLNSFSSNQNVVVVTADIPFIKGKDIDSFIELCSDSDVEIYYPLIPKEKIEARFPGASRTYFRIAEGQFTAGNVFFLKPEVALAKEDVIKKAYDLRKNPAGLVSLLGAGLIFKFMTHKLSIVDIETKVFQTFNINGKGLICDITSIGMDIDKPEDLQLAKAML